MTVAPENMNLKGPRRMVYLNTRQQHWMHDALLRSVRIVRKGRKRTPAQRREQEQ